MVLLYHISQHSPVLPMLFCVTHTVLYRHVIQWFYSCHALFYSCHAFIHHNYHHMNWIIAVSFSVQCFCCSWNLTRVRKYYYFVIFCMSNNNYIILNDYYIVFVAHFTTHIIIILSSINCSVWNLKNNSMKMLSSGINYRTKYYRYKL